MPESQPGPDRPLVLTKNQVREFDRVAIQEFGIPSIVLMENAARNATEALCKFSNKALTNNKSAVILCGSGNNGGDGMVIARHLSLWGWQIKVILFADPEKISQDSRTNFRIVSRMAVTVETRSSIDPTRPADLDWLGQAIHGFDWIIDGLVGTGASIPLRPPFSCVIEAANNQTARRMAIDLPSGLCCDSDSTDETVFNADLTVTFVARKPTMETATGNKHCGQITIVDIGAPTMEILQRLGVIGIEYKQSS